MRRRSGGYIVLGCVLLFPGCGATERSVAVAYAITVDVALDVNPDSYRKPWPIVLKLFQLKTASSFEMVSQVGAFDRRRGELSEKVAALRGGR